MSLRPSLCITSKFDHWPNSIAVIQRGNWNARAQPADLPSPYMVCIGNCEGDDNPDLLATALSDHFNTSESIWVR